MSMTTQAAEAYRNRLRASAPKFHYTPGDGGGYGSGYFDGERVDWWNPGDDCNCSDAYCDCSNHCRIMYLSPDRKWIAKVEPYYCEQGPAEYDLFWTEICFSDYIDLFVPPADYHLEGQPDDHYDRTFGWVVTPFIPDAKVIAKNDPQFYAIRDLLTEVSIHFDIGDMGYRQAKIDSNGDLKIHDYGYNHLTPDFESCGHRPGEIR